MSRREAMRRRYAACAAAEAEGRPLTEVAAELGLDAGSLRGWWRYQRRHGGPEERERARREAREAEAAAADAERAAREAAEIERRLRRLRRVDALRARGLLDYQVARRLGITKQALSEWLRRNEPELRRRERKAAS